jgi:predicted MPP superfamily phosphohydrolase
MFRSLALIAILLVFLAVLCAMHAYLALRLVIDPGFPDPWRGLALGAIALFGVLLFLEPFGERLLPPRRLRWLAWPAALWMGLAFVLMNLLLATDALLWFVSAPALAAGAFEPSAEGPLTLRAAGVMLVALVACGVALRQGLRPPRLVRERFELERWPRALDGFRIVQLSDVHIGPLLGRRFAAGLVERVNALQPDLVVLTGDLVDGSPAHLAEEVAPFGELRAVHGVYFVTGNHDHLSNASSWARAVSDLGITVLRNRHVRIEVGEGADGASFDLIGVDDHRSGAIGGGGEDLDAALRGRDPERPAVLLAHDPSTFRRARGESIDLQISGHTHGGQIWPFRYVVRLLIPWVAGRYREGGAQLYVSRGTGFWGPPMRLLAPAEITELTLHAPIPAAL